MLQGRARYLALPLHAAPLMLVAIFAVLLTLANYAGFFGLAAAFILVSWFLKYAFMVLDHAAQGRSGAPVLDVETANPLGEMRPWIYVALIAAFLSVVAATESLLGPGVATALRVVGLLALPAIVATHAISGSLAEALNPRTAFEMVRRLGSDYLFVLATALVCGAIGRWVAWEASGTPLMLRLAIWMLLWLAMFATLGGVIYERRLEIGYEPQHSPERRAASETSDRDRDRARFADRLFHEYRSGSLTNVLATIQERISACGTPIDEYAWMLERASAWPNPKLAHRLAQDLLPLLLAARRNGEALDVVQRRVSADPGFRPATAGQTITAALLARSAGNTALARLLVSDFEARFPDDPTPGSVEQLRQLLQR